MEISLLQKDPTNASIKVTLEESDYEAKVNEKIKDYSKKVQLKGFRPGKVPQALVKKMAGKSFIADEVLDLLNKSIKDYIKDNKLAIIGDPLPSEGEEKKNIDWENQKTFEFNYDLGIVPEFSLDPSKVKITKYEVEIEKKTMDETIENIKKQFGEQFHPETIEAGDFIGGDLLIGEEKEHLHLNLNDVNSKELKKFIGAKKGDHVIVDLHKALNKDAELIEKVTHLKGADQEKLKGEATIVVGSISRTGEAELNQDLFDKVFGKDAVKSLEEFNEKVKEAIQQNYTRDAETKVMLDIQDALVEKTKVAISDEFFKRWIKESNKNNEELTVEKLNADYPLYEKELKWTLIRNKFADDNKIEVQNEEVIQAAGQQIIQQYLGGMPPTPEIEEQLQQFTDKYLRENNGENYLKIYEQVLTDKVFKQLKEAVAIKDKKVKSEEFRKLASK